ncbi:hypothetical protein ACROYT_G042442 [Oculina patagonica]
MASAVPIASSTKETTNYARLCRLLVDIGTQALRDTFDAIHSPANLHAVLAGNITTLQPLRARKIINPIQWGKLFPVIPTSVSSRDFDTTLLMILLRNLCGLIPPLTGWDALPAVTDLSREADIARVKYFRNTVYGHAENASVDDAIFNDYWRDIRDTLVRLGGLQYATAIDDLRKECMDPEVQDHYRDLLSQWKKDEDNVKEQLNVIIKKLDVLTASKEVTDSGEFTKPKDARTMRGLALCKEKYHENEALEYYCQQCKVCICHKCGQTRHGHHQKTEIQQAAEERKAPMENVLEKSKAEVVAVKSEINEQIELRNKSKAGVVAAQNKMTEVVEELVRDLRDHEMAVKTILTEINETQEIIHVAKVEKFQLFVTELQSLIERGDSIFERGSGLEILQDEDNVFGGLEELLNQSQEMKIYKPEHVNFVVNKGTVAELRRLLPLGQVVASSTDHSQSVAEGNGLKEADCGTETSFTVTTRDSEGNQFYHEQDQVTVTISSSTGEEEANVEDCKDGNYTVRYKPTSVGRHDVGIEVNGWPLTGSPWSLHVSTHQYKVVFSCGSNGKRQGEFNAPWGTAKHERTGNTAVADYFNKRIQLFDENWKFLKTIEDVKVLRTDAVKLGHPTSVAFARNGDILVIHGDAAHTAKKLSVISDRGEFIEHFSKYLIRPFSVFVKANDDSHVIVCDLGDNKIKVLSPDGAKLLQSFRAPHCNTSPGFVCYYHDKFFVSYADCVKVFNKEGVFLYDIGSEESGDEKLCNPLGLTVDAFENLIVCDNGNRKLKIFTLDGKFLTSIDEEIKTPWLVTVCNNGVVLVSDRCEHCIHVLQ